MTAITSLSVVIPALNEATTIAGVVEEFRSHERVSEVIVVDNGSSDSTAEAAASAGATVIQENRRGYGRAIKTGFACAREAWVFKCDGDLRNPQREWLDLLLAGVGPNTVLVKGAWESPEDDLPVTNFATKPALRLLFPALLRFRVPLSGQYIVRPKAFDVEQLADDYYLELDMLTRGDALGLEMSEVWLGELRHTSRSIAHNSEMCLQILCGLGRAAQSLTRAVAVIMAHPDDPVIWAGGLMAKYLCAGAPVAALALCGSEETAAEMATLERFFPTAKTRCLMQNEFSSLSPKLVAEISDWIGEQAPDLLVSHHFADPHSDHRLAGEAVRGALLRLGRARFPRRLLMSTPYFGSGVDDSAFRPDIFLDISAEASLKRRLIDAHVSQEPAYWNEMVSRLEGLWGLRAGVAAAEAYETAGFYTSPAAQAWL